jgi:cation diffusion facilitator family transporter
MALWMLTLAAQPADAKHPHGHGKAEYFSSAFEGFLIVVAAVSIAWTAIDRLMHPQPLEALGIGLLISVVASIINFGTSTVLLRAGREHRSITLEADAHHLMTDVWTSGGVILGVGLVWASGWNWLDPAIAILVAINIVWTGWQLMHRSTAGLMDISLPAETLALIEQRLASYAASGISYHALRTRQAGRQSFISLHVLVPGEWTVTQGHDWAERIEADLRGVIPHCHVTTHLEPVEDPRSMEDQGLDRHTP